MFLVRKKKALQIVEERLHRYCGVIESAGKKILETIEDSDLSPSVRDYIKQLIYNEAYITYPYTETRNCELMSYIEEYNTFIERYNAVFALLCEMEDDL